MTKGTRSGLLVISFISAVLNFAGLSLLSDEPDWWTSSLAAMTALGVMVSLYLFWTHSFETLLTLETPDKRLAGWASVAGGCVVILALSAYWNVVAISGPEVKRLWLGSLIPRAETLLVEAGNVSGSYLGLKPQLDGFAASIDQLADRELHEGALTGAPGPGGVEKTLRQLSGKVLLVSKAVEDAAGANEIRIREARTCLEVLRGALRSAGDDTVRLNAASSQIDCLNQAAADIANQDIPGLIERDLGGLAGVIVIPKTLSDPGALEDAVASIQSQADRITQAAKELRQAPPDALIVEEPNLMLAVLAHWRSILPAIATAIAIDLLPLFLLILMVLRRRDAESTNQPSSDIRDLTLRDLITLQERKKQLTYIDPPRLPAPPKLHADEDWWEIDGPDDDTNNTGERS